MTSYQNVPNFIPVGNKGYTAVTGGATRDRGYLY